jgi:methionine synthase II (cobalamin-independent)
VFQANGLATLIGSLPLADHNEALDLILEYMPEIPIWAQLPVNREEGMMVQFTRGLPGICREQNSLLVNSSGPAYDNDLLKFYEDYMAVSEGRIRLDDSRFALTEDTAPGFFTFFKRMQSPAGTPAAVKGQITGPFTFCTGIVDQDKRAIFYEPQIKDAAVKLLAMKARWQAERLAEFQRPVIIFFDEPALAGFGSSEFTSISREEVGQCFEEVFEPVHQAGGLTGVHVCANTDWSLILDSSADIVSFDAYGYFDRFILYADQIKAFLEAGKFLAWGMVPTLNADDLEKETTASLVRQFEDNIKQVEALGIDPHRLINQSLITPTCGTGTLSIDLAKKVLRITREISLEIRKLWFPSIGQSA